MACSGFRTVLLVVLLVVLALFHTATGYVTAKSVSPAVFDSVLESARFEELGDLLEHEWRDVLEREWQFQCSNLNSSSDSDLHVQSPSTPPMILCSARSAWCCRSNTGASTARWCLASTRL